MTGSNFEGGSQKADGADGAVPANGPDRADGARGGDEETGPPD